MWRVFVFFSLWPRKGQLLWYWEKELSVHCNRLFLIVDREYLPGASVCSEAVSCIFHWAPREDNTNTRTKIIILTVSSLFLSRQMHSCACFSSLPFVLNMKPFGSALVCSVLVLILSGILCEKRLICVQIRDGMLFTLRRRIKLQLKCDSAYSEFFFQLMQYPWGFFFLPSVDELCPGKKSLIHVIYLMGLRSSSSLSPLIDDKNEFE